MTSFLTLVKQCQYRLSREYPLLLMYTALQESQMMVGSPCSCKQIIEVVAIVVVYFLLLLYNYMELLLPF